LSERAGFEASEVFTSGDHVYDDAWESPFIVFYLWAANAASPQLTVFTTCVKTRYWLFSRKLDEWCRKNPLPPTSRSSSASNARHKFFKFENELYTNTSTTAAGRRFAILATARNAPPAYASPISCDGQQEGKKMYSISVALGNTVWALLFKQRQTADNVWTTLSANPDPLLSPRITVEDDFSQRLEIFRKQIGGLLFEDLDISRLAHIERSLHQARTQVKAQQMAEADPIIRSGAQRSSPAILSPMMRGNGPPR
jgi:hypothetical protein